MDPRAPDSHFRPAPGGPPAAAGTGGNPSAAAAERQFPLDASRGLMGLLVGIAGTLGLVLVVAVAFAAAGADDLDNNNGFTLVATLAGDLALVAAALGLTADRGRPSAATFGFRPFKLSAIGSVAVAFFSYLVLAAVYTTIFDPPPEDLPDQFGADESVFLAVMTGIFVIGVAPVVEEFFFRGFLFQALRNSWGPFLGVVASAAIFAAIHFDFSKFVQLFILGVALALLFQKTGSLWPCIMLHAINNSLAFAVSV